MLGIDLPFQYRKRQDPLLYFVSPSHNPQSSTLGHKTQAKKSFFVNVLGKSPDTTLQHIFAPTNILRGQDFGGCMSKCI